MWCYVVATAVDVVAAVVVDYIAIVVVGVAIVVMLAVVQFEKKERERAQERLRKD